MKKNREFSNSKTLIIETDMPFKINMEVLKLFTDKIIETNPKVTSIKIYEKGR